MPDRYGPFSRRRDPLFPLGESVAPPTVDTSVIDAVRAEETVRAGLKARRTEDAGRDVSFYRYRRLEWQWAAQALNLLTYAVPAGRVLQVDNIEFTCTEPWLYGSNIFGWRLAVNGDQINNFQTQGGVRDDYLFTPLSTTTGNPADLFPVFVPANAEMEIEVVQLPGAVAASLTARVWVSVAVKGMLRKPAGGNI